MVMVMAVDVYHGIDGFLFALDSSHSLLLYQQIQVLAQTEWKH